MDLQQFLALTIVGLAALLMIRGWLRKGRSTKSECGGSCHCASAQKTIRYGQTRGDFIS
jgi:hypothetical protein